ncbi:MAG TPA: hypothetical protein VM512_13855 [Burkholderiaceae bacterium]|jgi:hypothetical protein|nr:hypothetical protein [Burkholderiaceae bacterium]
MFPWFSAVSRSSLSYLFSSAVSQFVDIDIHAHRVAIIFDGGLATLAHWKRALSAVAPFI